MYEPRVTHGAIMRLQMLTSNPSLASHRFVELHNYMKLYNFPLTVARLQQQG